MPTINEVRKFVDGTPFEELRDEKLILRRARMGMSLLLELEPSVEQSSNLALSGFSDFAFIDGAVTVAVSVWRSDKIVPKTHVDSIRRMAEQAEGNVNKIRNVILSRNGFSKEAFEFEPKHVQLLEFLDLEEFVTEKYRISDSSFITERSERLRASAQEVGATVPEQQVAPVLFGSDGEKLIVISVEPLPAHSDVELVASVRIAILKTGLKVVEALHASQCDRRFIETLSELHRDIETNEDIIQVGMQCQLCQVLSKQYEPEFSTFHEGILTAYLASVLDFVAQFPQWHRFLENAAGAKMLDESIINDLRKLVGDVVVAVSNPVIAAPEVADKVNWLSQHIDEGRPITKKAVYAVAQSMQNLAAALIAWVTDLVGKFSSKTQDLLANTAAITVVSSFAVVLWNLVPASNILAQRPWLADALNWLKEVLPLITGG